MSTPQRAKDVAWAAAMSVRVRVKYYEICG